MRVDVAASFYSLSISTTPFTSVQICIDDRPMTPEVDPAKMKMASLRGRTRSHRSGKTAWEIARRGGV